MTAQSGEPVPARIVSDQHIVSVRVDGVEVWEHRSTGAKDDAAAAEFAIRSWLLGRDRGPLYGKRIQGVVLGGPALEEATDG